MRLLDPANELLVSAASAWEIAITVRLGWLSLPGPAVRWVPSRTPALTAAGSTGPGGAGDRSPHTAVRKEPHEHF